MERTPDKWDAKAERIHGDPREEGAPVRLVGMGLPFLTVFVLAVQIAIAQALIGGAVVLVLVLLDVI